MRVLVVRGLSFEPRPEFNNKKASKNMYDLRDPLNRSAGNKATNIFDEFIYLESVLGTFYLATQASNTLKDLTGILFE